MYYNQNQFVNPEMRNQFYRYPNSVIYPRFNSSIRKVSSFNIGKILETTQRGINTINQIVPIYKQVTPVIKKVSSFTKSFSSFLFRNKEVSSKDEPKETPINKTESYRNNHSPENPYFK